MSQIIKLKRSATGGNIPGTAQLDLGEIGINTFDGKVFIKKDDGAESIVEVGVGDGGADHIHFTVKNTSAGALTRGQIVSITGYDNTNDYIEVSAADNTTGVGNGILEDALAVDAIGQMISVGKVSDLDTSAFVEGQILYTGTSGGLTNIEPTTGFSQPIAYVLREHATSGILQINADYPKQDADDVRYSAGVSVKTQIDNTASQLELITEGANTGYRLLGKDPLNFGDIGDGAVDFSWSSVPSAVFGATGLGAHAEGDRVIASGSLSHAEGYGTIALNTSSHAEGRFNTGTSVDTIHETGIGADDANRLNAFEIYTDGRVHAPEQTIALHDSIRSLTTKEYVDSQNTGLILHSNNAVDYGWVFQCRIDEAISYGNIGHGAVDFSASNLGGGDSGATGRRSFAQGLGTIASSLNAVAFGFASQATGQNSFSTGSAVASGNYSTAAGMSGTEASGIASFAVNHSVASGDYSHSEGLGTIALNNSSHAAGKYNIGTATDTIHETGIGLAAGTRQNGFEIYQNGRIHAPEQTIALHDDVRSLTTKEYVDTEILAVDGIATGLEAINDGNGIGWRLKGKDPTKYLNIGKNAVDISACEDTYATISGATGEGSFAGGGRDIYNTRNVGTEASGIGSFAFGGASYATKTTASGDHSQAFGYASTASGVGSHAEGAYTTASGKNSHAEGNGSDAAGDDSHAEGRYTEASGFISHAEGYSSVASGMQSHAEGKGTIALNYGSHAQGHYNIGTSTETIHETGIGNGTSTRQNGFEIYQNGRIHAPNQTIALHDNARSLTTREYLQSAAFGNSLPTTDPGVSGEIWNNAGVMSISI